MIAHKYKEDLNQFFKLYEENHIYPYFSISKEDINSFIKTYLDNDEITNDYDFSYMLKIIIKKLSGVQDSHMFFGFNSGHTMPVFTKYIDGDLIIINASDKYEKLIGSKILSINEIPISKLEKEMDKTIAHSTKGWYLNELASFSYSINRLLMLPSINSSCEVFEYELERDGIKTTISINKNEVLNKRIKPINYSIDTSVNNSIILHYNNCRKSYENEIDNLVHKLDNVIKDIQCENFILDLRGNTGGNSEVIKPLINYLKNSKLNLYTFVDSCTYSSGIIALLDMKAIGATIIGEEPGHALNSFGEIKNFGLFNTGFIVSFSTKYFILSVDGEKALKNKEEIDKNINETSTLHFVKPDYNINISYEDIINNNDPYIEIYNKIILKNNHYNK